MKAINQTIGRAIRHKEDYSCIILADSRFKNPNIMNKLPRWMVSNTDLRELESNSYNYKDLRIDLEEFYERLSK